jgi:hypothetical protein
MKKPAAAAIVTALLLTSTTAAHAALADIAAPDGARLLLAAAAEGVQIYACESGAQGFAWVFKAPEAALFDGDGRQILSHFAGPSWKAEDGTTLVGEAIAKADAPKPGAIVWLLLNVKSREGSGPLAKAGFVRRIDTVGGTPPAGGCDAGHAGKEARMRYSAVYEFYAVGE